MRLIRGVLHGSGGAFVSRPHDGGAILAHILKVGALDELNCPCGYRYRQQAQHQGSQPDGGFLHSPKSPCSLLVGHGVPCAGMTLAPQLKILFLLDPIPPEISAYMITVSFLLTS